MSKTIIIQKNGAAQTLTVDKLRLPDAAGGTENWLPADGKNLVNIEVKQNGTYRASDFSAYGIAEVKVKCTLNGGAATPKATEKLLNALHHPAPAEGGRARTMSAHHLETPQDGGGTVQWVPEEEVALGTKSVNIDNRTYKASDDGKYGYSEFTVSGISITKDGDTITHTDGTGTKTYTLPHHIRVEHPPLKIAYNDGETIDFSGMLVKAYNEDGTIWTDETHPNGVIPLEELILPVTVATPSGGSKAYAGEMALEYPENDPIVLAENVYGRSEWPSYSDPTVGYIFNFEGNGIYAVCNLDAPSIITYSCWLYSRSSFGIGRNWGGFDTVPTPTISSYAELVHDEVIGDYYSLATGSSGEVPPFPCNYFEGYSPHDFALQIFGGYITHSGEAIIPVQWARPWDAEILEDSFEIFVYQNPGYGGAEGGGGQTSGGGAGRDN